MCVCLLNRFYFQPWEKEECWQACLLTDVKLQFAYPCVYKIERNAALLIIISKCNLSFVASQLHVGLRDFFSSFEQYYLSFIEA